MNNLMNISENSSLNKEEEMKEGRERGKEGGKKSGRQGWRKKTSKEKPHPSKSLAYGLCILRVISDVQMFQKQRQFRYHLLTTKHNYLEFLKNLYCIIYPWV